MLSQFFYKEFPTICVQKRVFHVTGNMLGHLEPVNTFQPLAVLTA